MYRHVVGKLWAISSGIASFNEIQRFYAGKVSATSDRQSIRAKGLVMGLYDNLNDKLFYTRGILHMQ